MAEEEEAGVVTAAMGKAVAVEVMVTVEGVGAVEAVVDLAAVVDLVAAVGEADAVEVMVAAEGMVIVEVVVEMEEAVGETVDGASSKRRPDTKESSLDFARECVCTHYLLYRFNVGHFSELHTHIASVPRG